MSTSIIIVPSTAARFGYAIFEVGVGIGLTFLAQPWLGPPFGLRRLVLLGLSLLMVLAGLEFPWRRVVIDHSSIRERLWFHWRTHELPQRVIVGRDARGRIAVAEAPTGHILYRFIREFGKASVLQNQLVEYFGAAGRLDPDA